MKGGEPDCNSVCIYVCVHAHSHEHYS